MGVEVSSVSSKEWWTAQQGQYYVGITPTPGTGIIGHAAPTTFDQAKPYITLYNNGSKPIYPQFLHLHVTVPSVGGSRVQFTHTLDQGNRRSADGTAMTVSNTNSASNVPSGAALYIGAITGTAATANNRILGNVVYRGTIDIVEDDYIMVWGAPNAMSGSTSRVATVAEASRILPPVCIAVGDTYCITQWAGSQSTGPTCEAIFGFFTL